jgi:hypothetical protein
MLLPTDIEVLQRFQENHLLKTLSGNGIDVLPEHQMASNAITRLIQEVERMRLLLDNRHAKCWLYEDENKQPVFSISEPPYFVRWSRGGVALPLYIQKVSETPLAWMYLEDGEEKFTLDPEVRDQKTYKSLPAVPLYQNRLY